mgnify:CR=1 FL=1
MYHSLAVLACQRPLVPHLPLPLTANCLPPLFNQPQVRMGELCSALGSVMGRPSLVPVPDFALRTLLGEGASVVLEGQRVVPSRAQVGIANRDRVVASFASHPLPSPSPGVQLLCTCFISALVAALPLHPIGCQVSRPTQPQHRPCTYPVFLK